MPLTIGSLQLDSDLILAPMVGYCDLPFRVICRRMGSGLSYIPLILDEAVLHRQTGKSSSDFVDSERPVAMQMVSRDPERLLRACERLLPTHPDIWDLNLGCPSRHVTSAGRGSALLREPQRVGELVRTLVTHFDQPVTAKIRLGWDDDSRNYLEIIEVLEQAGVAAIGVHGRTRQQAFSGQADWDAIAECVRATNVPILGNGDVRSVADIEAMRTATGCAGILIGRGAVGNPWLFAGRDIDAVPYPERVALIHEHLDRMVAYHGLYRGITRFRKHIVRYVISLPSAAKVRRQLTTAETPEQVYAILDAWHPGQRLPNSEG